MRQTSRSSLERSGGWASERPHPIEDALGSIEDLCAGSTRKPDAADELS